MISDSLRTQAEEFATEVDEVIAGALPGAPPVEATVHRERVVIEPIEDVPLLVQGQQLASLKVEFRCILDSRGQWLAIEQSKFGVSATLDRTPILRYEFVRSPYGPIPAAHLQVHAHRGALSHLLSRAGHAAPHEMSRLHLPVGGARFRPCLEDVVEFVIVECGFDCLDTWSEVVRQGRERWRRTQLRAAVRDLAEEAADQLRQMGYAVTSPAPPPEESDRALHTW